MPGGRDRRRGEAPAGLRTAPLAIGSRALVVFSYPIEDAEAPRRARGERDDPRSDLTPAEREVGHAVIAGMSAAEIASSRARSLSTVNKQIESLYRKLGLHSKSELCARYRSLAADPLPRRRGTDRA